MAEYKFRADIEKFEASTSKYRGENALVLVDCARLSYTPEAEISEAMQEQWGFQNFQFFNGPSTQAFIAANEEIIIVSFRGTELTWEDLKSDAKTFLVPRPYGNVHHGFSDALQEVWAEMRDCINQFQDNKQTVWISGHSLGAALATLATAEFLLVDGGAINGLYTIGQPRVGDGTFASNLDAACLDRNFRFVNNNDVVTRVPLPGAIRDYTHVGNELYITEGGDLRDSISWFQKFWDREVGILHDIGEKGLDGLKDHSSDEYVRLIEKNRAVTTIWS